MASAINFLQQVARVSYEILEPFVVMLGEPIEEKKEMLRALGLDPAAAGSLPAPPAASMASVKAYIDKSADEVDELAFFGALEELVQITAALKAYVMTGTAGDDNHRVSHVTTAFLHALTLNYFKHRYPVVHKAFMIVNSVDALSVHSGGILNMFTTIGGFFKIMGEGFALDNEDKTKTMSDVVLFTTGVGLTLLNRFLFRRLGIPLVIDGAYGYDNYEGSGSPLADDISQRTLSLSIRSTASEDISGEIINTIAFMPTQHEGPAAMMSSTGQLEFSIDLADNWKFGIDTGGLGVTYQIGGAGAADLASNPYVKLLLEKDTDKKTIATIFDNPSVKLGYARTKFSIEFSKDDIEFKFKPTIVFLAGRGTRTGFPWTIIPEKGLDVKFDVALGFSQKKGFFLDGGGGGLTLALPIYASVGSASTFLFSFDVITAAYTSEEASGDMALELSLSFSFTIASIITASVSRTGLLFRLNKTPDGTGVIAGYDPGIEFKPPNGIGIAVNAGIVKGGGYLYFDADNGEYFGAMELSFQDLFSVKAVGIINTKLPDGSKGYSVLIIVTADGFNWQLGMGFSINGFGGILGLNRTVRVDALLDGLKTNTLKNILFPQDVVANINRIISDLKQVFPAEKDHFLVGPMVKIGWGYPTLVSLELGVIIDFPDPRVIILGVLKISLPTEKAALLRMQANFIGIIDIPNGYVFFRADLYDSRLLIFTLTGSIAFLVSWGEEPVFAMSVGGFHPDFKDVPSIAALPNGFKNLDRISISLLSGKNPRVTILAYHAVTSNTVQFGSKIELYAEACGFNVYGYLGYDVLFQLNPFHFIASFSAGLALRRGSSVIMGISLDGTLSGPKPWHFKGTASFSILFFDVSISIDETWGEKKDAIEEVKEDLQSLLVAEVENNQNWKAVIPSKNSLRVSVRDPKLAQENGAPAPANIVIHPVGILTFSQRILPLDVEIEKFGTRKPKDTRKFHVTSVKSGTTILPSQDVKEKFAAANFFEMKDNEKLARRSFESYTSGFLLQGTADLSIAPAVSKSVDYELSYLRKRRFRFDFGGIFPARKRRFRMQLQGNAVAKSSLSHASNRTSPNAPDAVAIVKDQYIVANKSNMKPYSSEMVAATYSEALIMYNELTTKQPALKNKVQILSQYEQNLN